MEQPHSADVSVFLRGETEESLLKSSDEVAKTLVRAITFSTGEGNDAMAGKLASALSNLERAQKAVRMWNEQYALKRIHNARSGSTQAPAHDNQQTGAAPQKDVFVDLRRTMDLAIVEIEKSGYKDNKVKSMAQYKIDSDPVFNGA